MKGPETSRSLSNGICSTYMKGPETSRSLSNGICYTYMKGRETSRRLSVHLVVVEQSTRSSHTNQARRSSSPGTRTAPWPKALVSCCEATATSVVAPTLPSLGNSVRLSCQASEAESSTQPRRRWHRHVLSRGSQEHVICDTGTLPPGQCGHRTRPSAQDVGRLGQCRRSSA